MAVLELKTRVHAHIPANIDFEVVRTTTEQELRVVFIPPYHSYLQPIEIPWARVEGNVGRKHTAKTALNDVVASLPVEFEYLRSDEGQYRDDGRTHISAMIDATTAIVEILAKEEFDNESAVEESGAVMAHILATKAVSIAVVKNIVALAK
uniref:Predicted protein putative n=1 Tax=Albugo laibachii Nc14 TaxID=890382 RepID=F0WKI2_9STRA|nr:predicted protein putative [Albugo laibachii Nc14]|eukprot:CCA21786.1 predicted protein putative [Albugo laibachii Nc14]